MAPVRKYIKLSKNIVVCVQIYLDQALLLQLAQKVKRAYSGKDTDSISELSPFSLPTKDVNSFLDVLTPHLVRVFSSIQNNIYSAHEFYNMQSKGNNESRKINNDVMNYKMDENGWKATIRIERPEDQLGFMEFTNEQLLERKIDVDEVLEEAEPDLQGNIEEDDEKPMKVKKNLTTKFYRLHLVENQKVSVYIQERPSRQ